jgi:hypothetical protein
MDPSANVQKLLASDERAKQLVLWARTPRITDVAAWSDRWRAQPALRDWLTEMKRDEGGGWPGFLYQCLDVFLGDAIKQSLEEREPSSPARPPSISGPGRR